MSQIEYTTKSTKHKHITTRERYKIEVLLKEKVKPFAIGKRLGKNVRTIEREIKRGMVQLLNSDLSYRQEYCADTAQRIYGVNGSKKGPSLKIGKDHELAEYIEKKIGVENYSPDAVIGEIKEKGLVFKTTICTKTLYNYIENEVFLTISNKNLVVKRFKRKRTYQKVKIAHKNLKGTSIEERHESVENREEYGHWEMDCVVGNQGGSGAALLVLSERKTRQEIIRKMKDKTQESVIREMDLLQKKYGKRFGEKFKTITVDNGSEFLDFKGLEGSWLDRKVQRVKVYYAHPYSSWERGTNENSNKLVRRFIPKGTDIGTISKKYIKYIEVWMNNYPRRILGYKAPRECA